MWDVLYRSSGEALIASCAIAWAFFFLSLLLEQSFITEPVRRMISSRLKLSQKRLDEVMDGLHIRAIGFMHNSVQVTLSCLSLTQSRLWEDSWHAVTPFTQLTVTISAGFFLWDTAISIRRAKKDGSEFIIHGALSLIFYLYISISNNFHFYGCGFLLWELSTPYVHMRWLMATTGSKNNRLYMINGMMMMAVFFLCRICWGACNSDLAFRYIRSMLIDTPNIPPVIVWSLVGICAILNGLNWYWFRLMLKFAVRQIFQKKSKQQSTAAVDGEKLKAT